MANHSTGVVVQRQWNAPSWGVSFRPSFGLSALYGCELVLGKWAVKGKRTALVLALAQTQALALALVHEEYR